MEEAPPVRARSGLIILLLLAGGCDRLFGIDHLDSADAALAADAAPHDMDRDGITDETDNCPELPNPAQRDVDGDGVGDLCDGCPLDPDSAQDDDDGDGIGDACDPHRMSARDCLVLADTFGDQTQFGLDWTIVTGSSSGIAFANDRLVLQPTATGYVTIYALGPQIPFLAPLDIEVVGRADLDPSAALFAVNYIDINHPSYGGKCGVRRPATGNTTGTRDAASDAGASAMPFGTFAASGGRIRLAVDVDALPSVTCISEIDGAAATQTGSGWGSGTPPAGGVGISAFKSQFAVDGVVLYTQRGTSEACAPSIRR